MGSTHGITRGPASDMLYGSSAATGNQPMSPRKTPTAPQPTADLGLESLQIRREAVYLALSQVPEGFVVSYGELARLAGLGRSARLVGRILSQLPEGSRLPWHRVIAAAGRISLPLGTPGGEEQRARLRAEGVRIYNDRVDIRRHGWLHAGLC